MQIIEHDGQEKEEWRPGVTTRMRVSTRTGANQLCIFEQWCDPGLGAPTHLHAVEEILTVMSGEADVWLDDQRHNMTAGQSLVIPAGHKHGFTNTGASQLHVQAILASPVFEAAYEDQRETPRRWLPQTAG
ncbi:MAG: cupin domain-containing protein [Hyphomicrobiaceae bacterium]